MTSQQSPDLQEVVYEYTPCFPEILNQLQTAVLISGFQAGRVVVLSGRGAPLQVAFHEFDRPMGLAVHDDLLAVGCRGTVETFERQPSRPGPAPEGQVETALYRRTGSQVTGDIQGHDLAWHDGELWIVNTSFSSLCALDGDSIDVRWKPHFITELKGEDRCHLNGLALAEGRPGYVTALGRTNEAAGWRTNKATAGCLIDIDSGGVIVDGLCMPHSPRHFAGRLWMLNSGVGAFGSVDLSRGTFEPVEMMPGYTRGLAFAGQYAFVGLSKIRETSTFAGIAIASHPAELHCGVGVVDLTSGSTVAAFQFHTGVTEIFAVETVAGFADVGFADL